MNEFIHILLLCVWYGWGWLYCVDVPDALKYIIAHLVDQVNANLHVRSLCVALFSLTFHFALCVVQFLSSTTFTKCKSFLIHSLTPYFSSKPLRCLCWCSPRKNEILLSLSFLCYILVVKRQRCENCARKITPNRIELGEMNQHFDVFLCVCVCYCLLCNRLNCCWWRP